MTAPDTAGPDLANRRRFTVAAFRATRRYPGPAGTVLARELLAWSDFGYRLGADRPLMALGSPTPNARRPCPHPPVFPTASEE